MLPRYISPLPEDTDQMCTLCSATATHLDDDSLPYCDTPGHDVLATVPPAPPLMSGYDHPEPLLVDVAPASGAAWVRCVMGEPIDWDGVDGGRWTAEYVDGVYHVYESTGLHGLEEEDYAQVHPDDILDVIANGRGKYRTC